MFEFVQFILQANSAILLYLLQRHHKKSHTRGYWDKDREETPKISQPEKILGCEGWFCLLSLKPPMQISMNDHHYRSTILLKDDTQCDIGTNFTNSKKRSPMSVDIPFRNT